MSTELLQSYCKQKQNLPLQKYKIKAYQCQIEQSIVNPMLTQVGKKLASPSLQAATLCLYTSETRTHSHIWAAVTPH